MEPPVYLVGVGMTPFGVHTERTVKDLTSQAVSEALDDAGANADAVEAIYFGNATQGHLEGQGAIRGQVALRDAGLHSVPISNVENACATGATALHLAATALRAGSCDIALAVGVEKMNVVGQANPLALFDGGFDVSDPGALDKALLLISGFEPDPDVGARSVFMDIYAAVARAHMTSFGTTQHQLATVSAKNHRHSVANHRAHYRRDLSVEQILGSRELSHPLTVPMCAPMTDGAAAVLLCTAEGLRKLPHARPVRLLACVLGSGSERAWDDYAKHVVSRVATQAYEAAGVGPLDVDVAEVHDATAFGELLQTELLGFAPMGEGGPLAESGATSLGGRLPINPSGGLESKGHPIGATGLGQVFELVEQLRGGAGQRQVPDARIGLAENGGGWLGYEEAAVVVSLLERVDAS